MINPFHEINWKPGNKEIRQFGKTIFIGFCIFAGLISWLSEGSAIILPCFLLVGGVLILITSMFSISSPKMVLPIYYVWFFVSACIGIVISNFLIMLFFFLIFSPFSYILRLTTGRDPLNLKKDNSKKSFWVEKNEKQDLKRYLKQY